MKLGYDGENGFNPYNFQLLLKYKKRSRHLTENGNEGGVADSRTVRAYAPYPLAISLARAAVDEMDKSRIEYILPDGKCQVTLHDEKLYATLSVQYKKGTKLQVVRREVKDIIKHTFQSIVGKRMPIMIRVNEAGQFHDGGPSEDIGNSITKGNYFSGSLPAFGGEPTGKTPQYPEVFGVKAALDMAEQAVKLGATAAVAELSYSIGRDKNGMANRPAVKLYVFDPSDRLKLKKSYFNPDDMMPGIVTMKHNLWNSREFLDSMYDNIASELYPDVLPWDATQDCDG
ncbi:MAG: hypothetical protein QMD85_00815 [Candidatus Aenigmarchaeota archaeon]|nr:hypothetical protein [Candidatus Aenigmarchaeota archaeon]MDI6722075.1 hypothetical protein [Candidatus Aenigmarchaeota archaeon]